MNGKSYPARDCKLRMSRPRQAVQRGFYSRFRAVLSHTLSNRKKYYIYNVLANIFAVILYIAVAGSAQTAVAQPAAIDIGDAKLYPSAKIAYVTNDNVFSSRSDPVEAVALQVEPRLVFVADKGASGLELGYFGNYLNTEEDSASFADHRVFFRGKATLSKKSVITSNISFNRNHVDFGSYISRGDVSASLDEPYIFNELRFDARYRYGAQRARGNLTIGLGARNRSYTNEPDPSRPNRTDGLNFSSVTPYTVFSVRVSGDTRAFLDLRFDTNEYDAFADPATAELDNEQVRAYIGSSWEITGRTGGSIKVGSIDTSYDDSRRDDSQTVGVEVDAFYAFKSYSTLDIGITREQSSLAETELLGREDIIDLSWKHAWSSRFSSEIGLQYTTTFGECVVGSGSADRENNDLSLAADFNLQFRRWMGIGLGYKFDDGQSSLCPDDTAETIRNFERNRVDLHLLISL